MVRCFFFFNFIVPFCVLPSLSYVNFCKIKFNALFKSKQTRKYLTVAFQRMKNLLIDVLKGIEFHTEKEQTLTSLNLNAGKYDSPTNCDIRCRRSTLSWHNFVQM